MDATKARNAANALRAKRAMLEGMQGIGYIRSDLMTIIKALEAGRNTATLKTECYRRNYLFNYLCQTVEAAGIELVTTENPYVVELVDPDDEGLELRLEPEVVPEEELGVDYGLGM